MNIKITFSYVLYGFTLIGSVLSHAFSNGVLVTTKEMVKRQSLKCNNHCPYGFVTDVEGDLTCACFNPCSTIMCLRGSVCVAEMPKRCQWEPCKPTTRCQAVQTVTKVRKHEDFFPIWKDVALNYQHDDPDQWWSTGNDGNVCEQPLPETAVTCKRKHRRWFYNSMTGKCERFMGCDTTGNNFSRKRYCKSQCRRHISVRPAELRSLQADDFVCSQPLPEMPSSCNMNKRRWFYNDITGKCEKFIGCESTGNNFSRKVFCKTKCRNKIRQFRQSSLIDYDSKEQTPR